MTLSAAEILGLGDSHGSLDVGKAATLILTTGDPLEITTETLAAWIDGRAIDLGSRHKALYAKYRQSPHREEPGLEGGEEHFRLESLLRQGGRTRD